MLPVGSVEIYQVPPGEAGGLSASIPSLPGKIFQLFRGALPLSFGVEYTIKPAGGFDLVGLPVLVNGERFALWIQGGKMNTARVPELADAVDIDLLNDYIVVYQGGAVDLTRKSQIADFRTLMITGGPATIAPALSAGTIIYIVPPADAGTDTASIAMAAGKSFQLRRAGLGMMIPEFLPDGTPNPDAEYQILAGGGFKLLKAGDLLQLDERFELVLYQLAPVIGPGTNTGLEFIKGKKLVNTNITLADVDMNKMIQIRSLAVQITVTLPDIDDVAENSVVLIDTAINSTVENKIQTTGGQFIYMQGLSRTAVYIRPGEVLCLYRDEDGWYVVINDFASIYDRIVTPVEWVHKVGRNQLACDGSLVVKADYNRAWEKVQTLGTALVTDAVWGTASGLVNGRNVPFPYHGCFSSGDGDHFRLPDLRNVFVRALKDYTGAADPERFANRPGGFQDDQIKAPASGTLWIEQRSIAGGDIDGFRAAHNAPGTDNYNERNFATAYPNNYSLQTETRGANVGLIPVINI